MRAPELEARGEGGTPPAAPPVTLHVWHVRRRHVPAAVTRMGLDRRLRRQPGVRFAKLLGTSDGRTFLLRDADLRRWALMATWRSPADAVAFEEGPVARGWGRIADERLRLDLEPLASRGRWSGVEPFGRPTAHRWDGPVASLTRARIHTSKAVAFHRAVPSVSSHLQGRAGLRLALGVGDAPFGLLGTFSVWDSAADLRAFAYGPGAHADVVRRAPAEGWFAEDLFARFAVVGVEGTFDGGTP